VLIDAENAQVLKAQVFKGLIDEISKYGTPVVKRCYGDFTKPNMQPWKALVLEHAITVEQQFAYTSGKNSSDVRLAIDAMDILYSPLYNVEAFFLISSDSDFAPLASRLRMAGKKVYAAGNKHTLEGFRSSVDEFILLETLGEENVPSKKGAKAEGKAVTLAVENKNVLGKNGAKAKGKDTTLALVNVRSKHGMVAKGENTALAAEHKNVPSKNGAKAQWKDSALALVNVPIKNGVKAKGTNTTLAVSIENSSVTSKNKAKAKGKAIGPAALTREEKKKRAMQREGDKAKAEGKNSTFSAENVLSKNKAKAKVKDIKPDVYHYPEDDEYMKYFLHCFTNSSDDERFVTHFEFASKCERSYMRGRGDVQKPDGMWMFKSGATWPCNYDPAILHFNRRYKSLIEGIQIRGFWDSSDLMYFERFDEGFEWCPRYALDDLLEMYEIPQRSGVGTRHVLQQVESITLARRKIFRENRQRSLDRQI